MDTVRSEWKHEEMRFWARRNSLLIWLNNFFIIWRDKNNVVELGMDMGCEAHIFDEVVLKNDDTAL